MTPYRVIIPVALLIGLGCLALAFVYPEVDDFRHISVGLLFGTMFGQTTLAAAWSALGPLSLTWRLPLSLLWVAALLVSFMANVARHPGPIEFPIVLAGCLLGQWLVVQSVLWGFVLGYGWRICFQATNHTLNESNPRDLQFGIRQLMILTAIIGVLFGVGRIVLANLPSQMNFRHRDIAIIIFLAVTAIVITLPLLLSALLRHWAIASTIALLVIIGIATAWEMPLLNLVDKGAPADVAYLLFSINFFTAASILAFVVSVRFCGYGIVGRRTTKSLPA